MINTCYFIHSHEIIRLFKFQPESIDRNLLPFMNVYLWVTAFSINYKVIMRSILQWLIYVLRVGFFNGQLAQKFI